MIELTLVSMPTPYSYCRFPFIPLFRNPCAPARNRRDEHAPIVKKSKKNSGPLPLESGFLPVALLEFFNLPIWRRNFPLVPQICMATS